MNAVLVIAAFKVLAVGNSFSASTQHELPNVAAAMGRELDLATMTIGGCSLEGHLKCLEKPSDRTYSLQWNRMGKPQAEWPELAACVRDTMRWNHKERKSYPSKGANLEEVLKACKWDVVTIQQASHSSWQPETYRPWADELCKRIRTLAPGAEIVMQETWSYTPWDSRLAEWRISPEEMYARLHRAYCEYASAHGYRVIPTGTAVQLWRKRLPVRYREDSFGGDVCGSATFARGKDGKWRPDGDVFHLNADGHYLQALVWCAKLFDVDVGGCPYKPSGLSVEKASLMKQVAMAAIKGM